MKVYKGKGNGEKLRKELCLDKEDERNGRYTIEIDSDILSVTPSFFISLFSKSVERLGFNRCFQKYKVKSIHETVLRDIEEGKDWLMK